MIVLTSDINLNPEPQDVGTVAFIIRINKIFLGRSLQDEHFHEEVVIQSGIYPICSQPQDFSNVELTQILMEEGRFTPNDVSNILHCFSLVLLEATSSDEYHQGCAFRMRMSLVVFLPHEEVSHHQTDDEDLVLQSLIEEVVQLSLDETNTIGFRPASKIVVGSLSRKVYKKTSDDESVGDEEIEMCTICLEEFKDGRSIVTLPCGHEFDDECIVEWFASSHVCPLCRFELPCEDEVKVIET